MPQNKRKTSDNREYGMDRVGVMEERERDDSNMNTTSHENGERNNNRNRRGSSSVLSSM